MKLNSPDLTHLVLLGGGHAQISVLKSFGMQPIDGLRITLVSRDRLTPYSGMLPGYIEGKYSKSEAMIDLVRLAQFAGARFIHDTVTGINPDKNELMLANHPLIHYDHLSINTGATPMLDHISGATEHALPIKPVPELIHQLDAITNGNKTCRHINIIGGGVAGSEVAFALNHRLNIEAKQQVTIRLIHSGARVVEQMNQTASQLINQAANERGIKIMTNRKAISILDNEIILDDQTTLESDLTLITTGAAPPAWLEKSGIETCSSGFIAINRHCQSLSHANIFATGDVATMIEDKRPKSGVFAVRAGSILRDNIRRSLFHKPLRQWHPQRQHLALIGIGGGKAMAVRGKFALKPKRVLWQLKEWIDRRFINRFTNLPVMATASPSEISRHIDKTDDPVFLNMQCMGCGGKAGWSTLSNALNQAYYTAEKMRPDLPFSELRNSINNDASQIEIPNNKAALDLIQTVDAISAITSDPFTLGRIATMHALSDLFAAHAKPFSALGLISLPRANRIQQGDDLKHILTAMLITLAEHGISLNGGHTVSSETMQIGLALTGLRTAGFSEQSPKVDDALILTKPLGIGLIMAGFHHKHPSVSGLMVENAINIMTTSNAKAVEIASKYGHFPITDVTGFGLMRHARSLADRFDPQLGLSISLSHLPCLEGTDTLLQSEIASSMISDNAAATQLVNASKHPLPHALLHDPQTGGGLLIMVPTNHSKQLLAELIESGHQAANIGYVNNTNNGKITVTD